MVSNKVELGCSPVLLANTVDELTKEQINAVKQMGFGCMLHLQPIHLRCNLIICLMQRCDPERRLMRLNNVEIPMCEWDVHCLMGLKNEGDTVCFEEYSPDPILLRKYTDGSTGKILVPNLISSIKNNPKADDHFKRCFVLLLIGTILAPNSKLEVPSYYLKLVAEVEQIQKYNWSKMMLDFLFSSIHTTKLEKHNSLHGCTIFLQLWYYEHVLMNEAYNNFGNSTFPLMANWNERRCKLRDKYDDQHGCGNGKIIMKLIMPSTEEYFIQRDRTEDYRNKNINARNGDKSARSNERSSSKIPNSKIKKETSAESPDKRNETERPVKPTIPKEAIDIISRRMSALERSVRRIEDEFKRRLSRIEDMLMELLKKSNVADQFNISTPSSPSTKQPNCDEKENFIPDLNKEWSEHLKMEMPKKTTNAATNSDKEPKVKSSTVAERVKAHHHRTSKPSRFQKSPYLIKEKICKTQKKKPSTINFNMSPPSDKPTNEKAKPSGSISPPLKTDGVKASNMKFKTSPSNKKLKDKEIISSLSSFPSHDKDAKTSRAYPPPGLKKEEIMSLEYADKFITDRFMVLVDTGEIQITGEQLACVNHKDRWLNDTVMDAYSTLLTHRLTLRDGNNKRIRYMSVFEYHTLSTLCKDVAKNVRFPPVVEMRWAKRGKELLEYDMVFFPINPGGHWYVIVMRIDLKDFLVLDSLERNESSYIMDMNFLRDGIQILIRKMRDKFPSMREKWEKLDITMWPFNMVQDIPRQQDSSSCGVFTLKFMQYWDGSRLTSDFTQANMDFFRAQIIAELILSEINAKEDIKKEILTNCRRGSL